MATIFLRQSTFASYLDRKSILRMTPKLYTSSNIKSAWNLLLPILTSQSSISYDVFMVLLIEVEIIIEYPKGLALIPLFPTNEFVDPMSINACIGVSSMKSVN